MTTSGFGAASFNDGTGDFNAMDFIARMVLNGAATATIVQVKSVGTNTVCVQPLVNQVDGSGNATPHGIVNNIRFIQIQSGVSAVIMPPTVGDIGLAVFADHDISSVCATAGQANPGSYRRFDFADGIYVTAICGLNAAPTQFIEMLSAAGGINITTPATATINAGGKTFTFGSSGFTMSDGIVAETHQHTYTPGSGSPTTTSGPVP
jgi:hypothetical protein